MMHEPEESDSVVVAGKLDCGRCEAYSLGNPYAGRVTGSGHESALSVRPGSRAE